MTATAIGVQPAIAIHPGQANSLHLTEIPRDEPGPGEVLVRVRQVGICGTDRELIHGSFGTAPAGAASLVLGHEMLGKVEAVGPEVFDFTPGQLVTATVRRPDGCPACEAGQPDMCQWLGYTERGIAGLHGFMTESVVEDVRWVVGVPHELAHVGVLLEPLSVVEKALRQANLIQRRISFLGAEDRAGPRRRSYRSARHAPPALARHGGRDHGPPPGTASGLGNRGGRGRSLRRACRRRASTRSRRRCRRSTSSSRRPGAPNRGSPRWRSSATTASWSSSPAPRRPAELTVPAAAINGSLLRGNKVVVGSVNSAREDFEAGVEDLTRFETLWPGLASRLITRHLDGLGDYARILDKPDGDIKTVIDVDEGFRVAG